MRKIDKVRHYEPAPLKKWKAKHSDNNYLALDADTRQAIRKECVEQQYCLCAYCGVSISHEKHDCHNEYVEPRGLVPKRALDFTNIVASCNAKGQCGDAHGSQTLPLTPFMEACETDIEYLLSGRARGKTQAAADTITVLNLGDRDNNKPLVQRRKHQIEAILWASGVDPEEGLEDDEIIQMLIDELAKPIEGKLQAYSPAVVSVLRNWLS